MNECACQGELLLHSAGEPVSKSAAKRQEPGERKKLLPPVLEIMDAMDARKELHVLIHREVPVETKALGKIADLLLSPWQIAPEVAAHDADGP